jgi:hypothetical protein
LREFISTLTGWHIARPFWATFSFRIRGCRGKVIMSPLSKVVGHPPAAHNEK